MKAAFLFGILVPMLAAQEKFEVASVKLIPPDKHGMTSLSPWGGATFAATNVSMSVLVELAFAVNENQIVGIERLGSDQYEVSARPEGNGVLSLEKARPMLRALLNERFQLVTHRENRDVSGYALTVAKKGPKLKRSDPGTAQGMILPGRIVNASSTMSVLAGLLAPPLGRPVIDATGIPGTFSIDLKFAREGDTTSLSPSIFTAVEEQLGLKLESRKVPQEMLVIDHCDRVPTEN